VLVIGHRGASGHAPENTLARLRKLLRWARRSWKRICISRAMRTSWPFTMPRESHHERAGAVHDMTLAELRRLDAARVRKRFVEQDPIPKSLPNHEPASRRRSSRASYRARRLPVRVRFTVAS